MAATNKRARTLDDNARNAARLAFLHDELNHAEVAARFHVAVDYIYRVAKEEDWQGQADDLGRDPEYLKERERQSVERARAKTQIERLHSKTAIMRAKAQHAVARKLADEAAQAKTPKEVHSVARALGPAPADITSGRLSVGLTTENTQISTPEEWKAAAAEILGPDADTATDPKLDAPSTVDPAPGPANSH